MSRLGSRVRSDVTKATRDAQGRRDSVYYHISNGSDQNDGLEAKRAMREESARLVADFLAKGGTIRKAEMSEYGNAVTQGSRGWQNKLDERKEKFRAKFGTQSPAPTTINSDDDVPPF